MNFKRSKKDKLQEGLLRHKISQETNLRQKIENYRFTPCGFWHSDLMKKSRKGY